MDRPSRFSPPRTVLVIALLTTAGLLATPYHASRAQPRDHGRDSRHSSAVVQTLPRGYHTVRGHNQEYFVYGGHFYEQRHGGYVVVHPPFGVLVSALPPSYVVVYISGIRYFFVGGAYFRPASTGYVIVEPPVPTAPPQEARTVMVQVSQLNVRHGPGRDFGVVTVVSQGARLVVYGTAPDWCYVRLPDGTFGWVMTRFTLPISDEPRG